MSNELDFHYMRKNLVRLIASLDDKTAIADEMARSLIRLANVADENIMQDEFIKPNIMSCYEKIHFYPEQMGRNSILKLTMEKYPSASEFQAIKKIIPENILIWLARPGDSIDLVTESDMNEMGWVKA